MKIEFKKGNAVKLIRPTLTKIIEQLKLEGWTDGEVEAVKPKGRPRKDKGLE